MHHLFSISVIHFNNKLKIEKDYPMMPPKQSIRVYHCSERTSYCFNDSKKSHNIEAYILEKLKDMGIDNGIELH